VKLYAHSRFEQLGLVKLNPVLPVTSFMIDIGIRDVDYSFVYFACNNGVQKSFVFWKLKLTFGENKGNQFKTDFMTSVAF
jgi:hypothetical protein